MTITLPLSHITRAVYGEDKALRNEITYHVYKYSQTDIASHLELAIYAADHMDNGAEFLAKSLRWFKSNSHI